MVYFQSWTRAFLIVVGVLVAAPVAAQVVKEAPSRLSGETRDEIERDADAYCEFVQNAARSESLLLESPWLVGSVGTLESAEIAGTGLASSVPSNQFRLRARVGLGFSPSALYEGVVTQDRAAAECARYRATARLKMDDQPMDRVRAHALRARILVIEHALPDAERILGRLRARYADSRATIADLNATSLRVDALRQSLAEARIELASLPKQIEPVRPLSALLRAVADTERDVERLDGRLRRVKAFDVRLLGGYERVSGLDTKIPAFGLVAITLNPGWLFQGAAESRAERAHARWVQVRNSAAQRDFRELQAQLAAELDAVDHRLKENNIMKSDLETRYAALTKLETDTARDYAEYMWFDLVKVRAEHAELDAQVTEPRGLLKALR